MIYLYISAVPLTDETHSAADVPLFASGPMSFLFDGYKKIIIYSYIFQINKQINYIKNIWTKLYCTCNGITYVMCVVTSKQSYKT